MRYSILNAFVDGPLSGNPAAVVFLDNWLADDVMRSMAEQFAYSETAFLVQEDKTIQLRWFTPTTEVDMCGHATMAASQEVFNDQPKLNTIHFQTRSGIITVNKATWDINMDFPARKLSCYDELNVLSECLCVDVTAATIAGPTVLALVENSQLVKDIEPDLRLIADVPFNAVIPTAPGDDVDFVSRVFAPRLGIPEDPVTGAAHTGLAPFWANRLNKNKLVARQVSSRGGRVVCEVKGGRVILGGRTEIFARGTIQQAPMSVD